MYKTFCVISHTHWDREWYMPLERFRMRLVELPEERHLPPGAIAYRELCKFIHRFCILLFPKSEFKQRGKRI